MGPILLLKKKKIKSAKKKKSSPRQKLKYEVNYGVWKLLGNVLYIAVKLFIYKK